MRSYKLLTIIVIAVTAAVFIGINIIISGSENSAERYYAVEIERACRSIYNGEKVSADDYKYITAIKKTNSADNDFFDINNNYAIRIIDGSYYRFEYSTENDDSYAVVAVYLAFGIISVLVIGLLIYIRQMIIRPFEQIKNVPTELSKGNLSVPIRERKSRYFGKFVWGLDLLREKLEKQKAEELALQKEKKTLLLSISHDIKTPLSAIKLYSKALSKDLYSDVKKQHEVAENINAKADEIENFVSELVKASSEDFLRLEVNMSEFYLSAVMSKICGYYSDKLAVNRTDLIISEYSDCLLKGDLERAVEVLQNIIENAIKYGDGNYIRIRFSDEENCRLVTIANSGCTLPDEELSHIFDSFWRGSNSDKKSGSGLGLYICRQLMNKMGGDIFAEKAEGEMKVTVVFTK